MIFLINKECRQNNEHFAGDFYGVVQGITEFLPVSSTAHLALLPWLSGWQDYSISAGRFMGMTREAAAKFTFLMSCPIILGDALYHAKDMINTHLR